MAEFQDGALLKKFAQSGAGLFVAPTVIADDVISMYKVAAVGRVDQVQQRFYAISVERRLRCPAVTAILDAARQQLFVTGSTDEAA